MSISCQKANFNAARFFSSLSSCVQTNLLFSLFTVVVATVLVGLNLVGIISVNVASIIVVAIILVAGQIGENGRKLVRN